MVKKALKRVVLFLALVTLAFSITSCVNQSAENVVNDPNIASSATPPKTGSLKNNDYPPLVSKAAEADMLHLDGTTSKIIDKKGSVLLLNLWATWCGPCRSEIPELVKLQETFGSKGLEVIGLNADEEDTKEMIDEFTKELKINYTVVWAPTPMMYELFKISKFDGIPQSFVIDREGRLRGVFKGASESEIKKMENTVAKVVNE